MNVARHRTHSPQTLRLAFFVALVLLACACGDDGDPSFGINTSRLPPVAALTASPATVAVGQPVLLDASDSEDPDGYIVEYIFQPDEDGPLLTSASPRLTTSFDEAGTYNVALTVVDDGGTKNTTRIILSVR